MPKLKNLITIFASIFLFLSLLGIIGGNSFLTILKRSFLGSLILSSLISGAFYIIKKIISEISASDIGEGQPEQDIDSDPKNIDIVLDQENPFEAEDEDTSPDSISKIGASSSAESLVEEVAEDALGDISSLEIKTNDNEVIEVMNDNSNNNGSMQSLDSNADLFGDLDTQASSSNKKENQVLNSLGENATPQIIAKAIKTVLTRDNNKG
ncbi:MAG: hypothetical protein FWE72_02040 [Spirochaetaceae bacterium]|nr:hypothetical protein [Spirochaetaceae bacterium]